MPDLPLKDDPSELPASDGNTAGARGTSWWPPSPKFQIVAIAGAIVLFNCVVIALVAAVFLLNSG